ncbi:MAG: DUF4405 domain-containing protein [Campylobacteraceae bacterium]|nr:DUF4405 domain-containing protein [Campylobacteraceae bacterium]
MRITTDFAMIALVLFAFAYRVSIKGVDAHEYIGFSAFLAFAAHNIINRRWYANIAKGGFNARRIITTACNLALALAIITLILTGLAQSRKLLSFLSLSGSIELRKIHTTAAYWSLILLSTHIGIHWQILINAARKTAGNINERLFTLFSRVLGFFIIAFGVWSSFDRAMFSKLFMGFSFDYWDMRRPAVLFFIMTLSIMCLYIFLTHYALKLISVKRRKK